MERERTDINSKYEGKGTHRSVDEHPQEFSTKGLQQLPIVELAEGHLQFHNVVFQNDLQESLIHLHDIL